VGISFVTLEQISILAPDWRIRVTREGHH